MLLPFGESIFCFRDYIKLKKAKYEIIIWIYNRALLLKKYYNQRN